MEFIFPLAVIVYLLFAVIGAVLKYMQNPPDPNQQPDWGPLTIPVEEEPPLLEEQEFRPEETAEAPSDLERNEEKPGQAGVESELTEYTVEEDKTPQVETPKVRRQSAVKWTKQSQLGGKPQIGGRLRGRQLAEAVILSEILREPRSRRPWPSR